jgi:hypothetical protein
MRWSGYYLRSNFRTAKTEHVEGFVTVSFGGV